MSNKDDKVKNKLTKEIAKWTIHRKGWQLPSLSVFQSTFKNADFEDETEDELICAMFNSEEWILSRMLYSYNWYVNETEEVKSFFIRLIDKGLSNKLSFDLYQYGIWNDDIGILKHIGKFTKNQVLFIMQRIKFENLSEYTKSKHANVRYAAYTRLGRDASLDKMSKDKIADVRLLAVSLMPYGDPLLKEMCKSEKSGKVLAAISRKIKKEDMVFLIGKKSRAKWAQRHFEEILKTRTAI